MLDQGGYGMNFNQSQPYQYPAMQSMRPQMPQQPVQGLIRVTGIEGAKAYQLPANSVIPLFDSDNDIMYVKSTDGAGFPTIKTFAFAPIEPKKEEPVSYVTQDEFNLKLQELKELIENGKQPVSAE